MDKDVVFKLRVSVEDRAIMQKLADSNSLSVAAFVRLLVRAEWRRTEGK